MLNDVILIGNIESLEILKNFFVLKLKTSRGLIVKNILVSTKDSTVNDFKENTILGIQGSIKYKKNIGNVITVERFENIKEI